MNNLTEYLLVIAPPEAVRTRIQAVRQSFREKYAYAGYTQRPQISMLRFHQRESMETRLVAKLERITREQPPLMIELRNFGSFPTHTLYIHVEAGHRYTDLVKSFREAQPLMKADPEKEPHFMLTPFIKIAWKLLPWQYEKSSLEYSHRQFSAKFIADSVLLLKRRAGEREYQIVKRMELLNEPVAVQQGSLFI